jgi:CRP-like cAMP-binding protein
MSSPERRPSASRLPVQPSAGRRSSFGRATSLLGFNRMEKVQLLAERSPLGAYLSPDELNRLSKLCTITKFRKGKPIQADSPFYLVIDGVVAVMDDDAVTELTSRRAGAFFTRMAGRGAVKGRKAKMVDTTLMGKSSGSVLLGPTDEEKLDDFYLRLSLEAREGYDAIISTNISTVLSSVNFINEANLSQAMLRKCGELCSYMPLRPGGMVFEQGDEADAFFIVLKGRIEAFMGSSESDEADHGEGAAEAKAGGLLKGVGETFGVAALVLGATTRSYGMRAIDMALFIRIGFGDFTPFLDGNPGLSKSLLYSTKLFLVQVRPRV